jgi:hypothetical protein
MENRILAVRPQLTKSTKAKAKQMKSQTTGRGTGLVVPNHILDDCKKSFTAAQQMVTKASKNFYSDTGIMALLCRHDCVLWLVNLTTPGERQHYALALIEQLFKNLPPNWTVGFLYDIACQLHRSLIRVQMHLVECYAMLIPCFSSILCLSIFPVFPSRFRYFMLTGISGRANWCITHESATVLV